MTDNGSSAWLIQKFMLNNRYVLYNYFGGYFIYIQTFISTNFSGYLGHQNVDRNLKWYLCILVLSVILIGTFDTGNDKSTVNKLHCIFLPINRLYVFAIILSRRFDIFLQHVSTDSEPGQRKTKCYMFAVRNSERSIVMFLSFRTDRSGQTVQTQMFLEEQSDQGLHCLQFPLHLLDAIYYGKTILFNF